MKLNTKQLVQFVFVVGCPRSGTTFLQSLIASHSSVHTVPETQFFNYLFPQKIPRKLYYFMPKYYSEYKPFRKILRRILGLTDRSFHLRMRKFFIEEIGRPELMSLLPKPPFSWNRDKNTINFLKILNKLAIEQDKSIFLEKTPNNLLFIEYIEKFIPNAKFIHLIRKGEDVVASLYQASPKWGFPISINGAIQRWKQSIDITISNLSKPNHTLVVYEKLLESPNKELAKICGFMGINFEAKMIEDYKKTSEKRLLTKPERLRTVDSKIPTQNTLNKFRQLFNEEEQKYIVNEINGVYDKVLRLKQ